MNNKNMLFLYAENDVWLPTYREAIEKHNRGVQEDAFANSGFDLFVPQTIQYKSRDELQFVSMKVKGEMKNADGNNIPFYLYPRSSLSKTPLSLANHVGIIDAGYRGSIIAALRCCYADNYKIEEGTKLVQICSPDLSPFLVTLLEKEGDLSSTQRGQGGFGSTS